MDCFRSSCKRDGLARTGCYAETAVDTVHVIALHAKSPRDRGTVGVAFATVAANDGSYDPAPSPARRGLEAIAVGVAVTGDTGGIDTEVRIWWAGPLSGHTLTLGTDFPLVTLGIETTLGVVRDARPLTLLLTTRADTGSSLTALAAVAGNAAGPATAVVPTDFAGTDRSASDGWRHSSKLLLLLLLLALLFGPRILAAKS